MKQTFEVLNVKCGGCASTVTKPLKHEFGEVNVDLENKTKKINIKKKAKK